MSFPRDYVSRITETSNFALDLKGKYIGCYIP